MPRNPLPSNVRILLCALIALLLAAVPNLASAAEATVNVDVPGSRWKAIRLKSLPEGASIALEILASDKVRVIIVDSVELKRFPKTRALFEATVDKKLGFRVVIPRSGDYYVIFDNRTSLESRQIRLRVQAEPPTRNRHTPEAEDSRDRM